MQKFSEKRKSINVNHWLQISYFQGSSSSNEVTRGHKIFLWSVKGATRVSEPSWTFKSKGLDFKIFPTKFFKLRTQDLFDTMLPVGIPSERLKVSSCPFISSLNNCARGLGKKLNKCLLTAPIINYWARLSPTYFPTHSTGNCSGEHIRKSWNKS